MIRRFGIRTRLTAIVSLVFTAAILLGAIIVVGYVEQRLKANTLDQAEALLADYLDTAAQGGPLVATVEPDQPGAFFYLDADGNQMTQAEYVETLMATVPPGADDDPSESEFNLSRSGAIDDPASPPAGAETVGISIQGMPIGSIREVDLGPDDIAVAQRVRLVDGTELYIGVRSPLQPVVASVTAIQTVLWIVVPILAIGVGALTHVTVGRVLRPVHSITRQTREISATNLSGRVPVPESRDDIAELATTMNDMLTRLDQAQQRQRQFIADASHELRSPIAASQSQLEVSLAHPDAADWPTTANAVLDEQTQLGALVDDLLALASLDEQDIGSATDIDLGELIRQETSRPHHVMINTVLESDIRITGNRVHLARAIRNVIDNADQHANSRITVTVTHKEGPPTVYVDDDGPGVPVEQREQIFERFTRLDEPRSRDSGGAGLGLAIVKQVIQAHGGKVECTGAPMGGARITMRFPFDAVPNLGERTVSRHRKPSAPHTRSESAEPTPE